MLENKGANLKSFLLIKAGAITDVPSTRSFSCLAILTWAFSGVIFIRCIRSHPPYFPSISFSRFYFFASLCFSIPLFLSYLSTSAPIYFIRLFHSRPLYVHIPLFSPLFSFRTVPEQFKGMFWVYPRPFWKSSWESVVVRCILLGIFTEK